MEPVKNLQNKLPCNDEIPIVELVRFVLRYKVTLILFVVLVTVAAGLYEASQPTRYIARSYVKLSTPFLLKCTSNSMSHPTLHTISLMIGSTSFHKELTKSLQANKYQANISKFFSIKYLPSHLVIQVKSQERETAEKLLRIWLETFKRYMRELNIELTIADIQDEINEVESALSVLESLQTIRAKKQQLASETNAYEYYYLQALLSLELQQELEKEQKKKFLESKRLLVNILSNFVQESSESLAFPTSDNKIISIARSIIERKLPIECAEIELIHEPRRIVIVSLLAFILSSGGVCIVMVGIFGLLSHRNERPIK